MSNAFRAVAVAALLAFLGGVAFSQGDAVKSEAGTKAGRAANCNLLGQTVVSVNAEASSITVKSKDGKEQMVVLSKDVKIKEGKSVKDISSISSGSRVSVYFKKGKDGNMEPSTIKIFKAKTE